jgi:hypothetical protein
MNERLSPNRLPPTTTAATIGKLVDVLLAIPTAMGVSAAIVPQLVPILKDTTQAAMNKPTKIKSPGNIDNVIFTTLSTQPISLAMAENAPAKMNISNIRMMPPWSSVLRGGTLWDVAVI